MPDDTTPVPANWSTADLADEIGAEVASCDTQFTQFGRLRVARGVIATVQCYEDNVLIREALSEPGDGRVLVVDGGESLHVALLGDEMAKLAVGNGWIGIVLNGAVRDVSVLAGLDFGVKALGSNPRKSLKERTGRRDVEISFGGVTFRPGDEIAFDDDGIVVLPM